MAALHSVSSGCSGQRKDVSPIAVYRQSQMMTEDTRVLTVAAQLIPAATPGALPHLNKY